MLLAQHMFKEFEKISWSLWTENIPNTFVTHKHIIGKSNDSLNCFPPMLNKSSSWRDPMEHSALWRHNERDGVSKHRRHAWLFNRFLRRRSKKTSKLRVTGLCRGIHQWSVDSPHKGPVTRKMFSFDDVIMYTVCSWYMPSKLDSVIVNDVFYDSVKTHRGLVTSYAVNWVNIAFSNCLSSNRLVVDWALTNNLRWYFKQGTAFWFTIRRLEISDTNECRFVRATLCWRCETNTKYNEAI